MVTTSELSKRLYETSASIQVFAAHELARLDSIELKSCCRQRCRRDHKPTTAPWTIYASYVIVA